MPTGNVQVVVVRKGDGGLVTGSGLPVACHWFLACANQAAELRDHPVLGNVPICAHCARRVR
jgi:hypothetical protein